MADLINIGTGALLSFQAAINTTGHNIANMGTEGYSRQRVSFESLPTSVSGLGNGVDVDSIQRVYNEFLTADLLTRSSSYNSAETYYSFASQVDSLFGDAEIGLQSSLDAFYASIQDVANNPAAVPERQALLGQASQLVAQFQSLDASLDGLNQQLSYQINETVGDINTLTVQIASVNDEIAKVGAASGTIPNDLLDKRDVLVKDLASLVSIRTVEQSDGALNISLSNGTSLVAGAIPSELTTFANQYDASKLGIGYAGRAGNTDISNLITGGTLGGVLDFREEVLDPARSQLGLIAASITETMNEQHRLGMDLEGQIGTDFFNPATITTAESQYNTGTAAVAVTINDVRQMDASEYQLDFDGLDWTLTNLSDGSTQTGAGPFTVDGISVSTSGTAAAGDSFLIRPTLSSADQFSLAINDPRSIAAASAIRAEQPLSNGGTASISDLNATDPSELPLAGDITLTFNPNALGAGVPGFDVTGVAGGPLAYDPATESAGTTLTLGGMVFEVSGQPDTGDTLVITSNAGGTGDNSNASALAALQLEKTLLNGTASQQDIHSRLVADVGIKTSSSEARVVTEGTLLQQSEQSIASVSGVNLDEEAADLIRYQQAYQAAAQVISVAQTLFSTLLNATGR